MTRVQVNVQKWCDHWREMTASCGRQVPQRREKCRELCSIHTPILVWELCPEYELDLVCEGHSFLMFVGGNDIDGCSKRWPGR